MHDRQQWVELRPSTVKLIAFTLDGPRTAMTGRCALRLIAAIDQFLSANF
jgi:hypothetical protein